MVLEKELVVLELDSNLIESGMVPAVVIRRGWAAGTPTLCIHYTIVHVQGHG